MNKTAKANANKALYLLNEEIATAQDKIDIVEAFIAGKTIEYGPDHSYEYACNINEDINGLKFMWESMNYRVKPEPQTVYILRHVVNHDFLQEGKPFHSKKLAEAAAKFTSFEVVKFVEVID